MTEQEMCHNVTNAPKDMIFLELRPEVKVTVTRRQYTTFHDPKVYPHIEFGIPTSNNIGNMLWTRIRLGQTDSSKTTVNVLKFRTPAAC